MGKIGDSVSNNCCSVPQCKSRSTNEISLFRFPKDESQRKKWANAVKSEKEITPNMQICSRHFVKSDYITSDGPSAAKVKRLKKTAVPSQNLPWQFPNKRVSPGLAKARMERLKNRTQQKVPDSPDVKSYTPAKKIETGKKSEASEKTLSGKTTKVPKTPEPVFKEEAYVDGYSPVKIEVVCEELPTDNMSVASIDKDNELEGNVEEATNQNEGETAEANEDNMPTRAPTRLNKRQGLLKCELCGRKCLTPQALQTHQHTAHKNARNNLVRAKKESPANNKNKSSPKRAPVPLISVKSPEILLKNPSGTLKVKSAEKSLNLNEVEKLLLDDSDYLPTASDSSELSVKEELYEKQDQRKTEFECPKCKKRFAVYFMASKHIQKHHSGPQNGNKMTQAGPNPIPIEICTICSTKVEGNSHICCGPLKLAMAFICAGCKQEYKTLSHFDMHKSSKHSEGVESMFFSTLDEFEEWKVKMEEQTRVKYNILDQNDTKKIHRCTHRKILGSGTYSRQQICPSCIVVQEFTKGFQVHYYPIHHDHPYQMYNLSNAFKRYSISSLMNFTAKQLPDSEAEEATETDLYLQFKKITESLVNEAARINVNGLKTLMRKALDMMAIVNSYVEDDDDDNMMTSNSVLKLDLEKDDLQDQVKKALSSLKRKPERIEVEPALSNLKRKPERIEVEPALSSLKRKPERIEVEPALSSLKRKPERIEVEPALSSLKRKPERIEVEPVKKKKSVFQSTENTPKNVNARTKMPSSKLKDETANVKRNELKSNQSPTFIDSFQDFVGKTFNKTKSVEKKRPEVKKTVKTKMGQFKPKSPSPKRPEVKKKSVSLSPKSPSTSISSRKSFASVKELEYEVKEQENDCNILILKI